jgi:hypothetical protein
MATTGRQAGSIEGVWANNCAEKSNNIMIQVLSIISTERYAKCLNCFFHRRLEVALKKTEEIFA